MRVAYPTPNQPWDRIHQSWSKGKEILVALWRHHDDHHRVCSRSLCPLEQVGKVYGVAALWVYFPFLPCIRVGLIVYESSPYEIPPPDSSTIKPVSASRIGGKNIPTM